MRKLFPVLPSDFFFTSEEKEQGRFEMLQQNLLRLSYLIYLGLPVTLIHILVFSLNPAESDARESAWRSGIISSHLVLFSFFLFAGTLTLAARKRKKTGHWVIRALPHLVFLVLLVTGGIISGIDQLVTNAITPYLIVCLCSAMLIYIPPFSAFIYFAVSYVVYHFAIGLYQTEPQVLLSNYVNGITSIFIGWFLSLTFWRNQINKFRKDYIIKRQQTELAGQNERLRSAAGELHEAIRIKDKLFSIISHDLRGPFASLNDLIRYFHSGDINEKEFRELLPGLYKQTELTNELLENLLSWSRSNLKGAVVNPEEIDLITLANRTIQLYHHQAANKHLQVINKIDPDHQVWADRGMISLVFRNLFSNAIKFSEPGGEIIFDCQPRAGNMLITIQDNGTGIPEEKLSQIFSETAVSTTGTAGEKGTGLGLLLCREFVEKNGGSINASSTLGKGSIFSISLPSGR